MKRILLMLFGGLIVLLILIILGINSQNNKASNTFTSSPKTVDTNNASGLKPGTCKILEEKYCTQGKLAEKKINGKTYSYIGFNLPEGTVLFAPYAGLLLKDKENSKEFNGMHGVLKTKDYKSGSIYTGDIGFNNMMNESVTPAKIIGHITNTGATNLGKYNLIYTINNSGKDGPATNMEALRSMFKIL